jgi:hypothetical protein
VGIARKTYVWDDRKNLIELNEYKWDLKTNGWVETSQTVFEYDLHGNVIKEV